MKTEYELMKTTYKWLKMQSYKNQALDEKLLRAKLALCKKECNPDECYNCGFSNRPNVRIK
jgi:hypothetical protein